MTVALGTGDAQEVSVGAEEGGSPLSIGGALRVTTADDTPPTGAVYDEIYLHGVRVGLGTTVTTGAGQDMVFVDDSSFAGPFDLATNAGRDFVYI